MQPAWYPPDIWVTNQVSENKAAKRPEQSRIGNLWYPTLQTPRMREARSGVLFRFGSFQLDPRARELSRNGIKLKVPDQSLQVLAMLLAHPGEVVTREELRHRLWPNGTIVEFDHSINAAIKRLRQALEDSAEEPTFVETLPRRGYRFLAPVERVESREAAPSGTGPAPGSGELIGQTYSHYRVLRKLGQGAMGVVYQAEDTRLGRSVALKFLPEELHDDPKALERFEREARAASALNHPNICTLHVVEDHQGVPFIAMEYVAGRSLDQMIGSEALPVEDVLDYAIQIADALAKAHSAGIIHRDLKPANVMVTEEGSVKLLDFGLAKVRAVHPAADSAPPAIQAPVTGESTTLGTPSYMAPEQVQSRQTDARTYIFALGAVIYEMATGRQAFAGGTFAMVSEAILNRPHTPASRVNPSLPAELDRIINRALEKDRDARYQSAAELSADLKRLKRERELATVPAPRNRIRPLWPAAVLAVIAVVGLAMWLRQTDVGATPTPTPELVPGPLTTYPGDQDSPTFSPDGNEVAFWWEGPKPGSAGIYAKVIGQDPPVLLARTKQNYAAWSPDGRFIAFVDEVPGGNCGIFLVPAIGGPAHKIAEISVQELVVSSIPSNTCVPVSWHPNGQWLVGVDKITPDESCALFLISVPGGEKRRLTSPSGIRGDHWPAVSPDGRAVAFIRYKGGNGGSVEVLELADDLKPVGEPRPLVNLDFVQTLAWMPDGRSLIFSSGIVHSPTLFRLRLLPGWRPGRRERLTFAGESAFSPAVSRQGRLAFGKLPIADADIWRLELSGGRWNGKPPVRLISSTRHEHTPSYSPDGQRIAFASARSGSYEIWICDRDGSNPVQLTSFGGPERGMETASPSWSPDGRWIYFNSPAEGHGAIYVISSEGGRPKRLTDGRALSGSVSRDGHWIYFGPEGPGAGQTWKMPTTGGDPVQVTRQAGDSGRESPDGRVLYYAKAGKDLQPDCDSLWKVPVGGGEEAQVLKTVHCGDFAVTDQGIYFVPGVWAPTIINFLNFSTNRIEQIAKFDGQPACGLSLSPDGRYLLYTVFEPGIRSGTGLMLVENFR